MTIKVKHILFVMLAVVITMLLYKLLKQSINELLTKRKYEKQIVDYLNLYSFDNMSNVTINRYNYYKNYYNEPYIDISPLIESYIKQVETNDEHPFGGGYSVELTSDLRRTIYCRNYTYILKLYHGIDRTIDIEQLEKILIHKGNDKYSGWCIRKDSPEIIDLPYNFYLKYEPSDFKLLDKVKKVTKCKIVDSMINGHYRKAIKVEYVDKNGENKAIDKTIIVDKDDDNKVTISISGLYYSETHNAKIELCNYDYEIWSKEKKEREANEPWNW